MAGWVTFAVTLNFLFLPFSVAKCTLDGKENHPNMAAEIVALKKISSLVGLRWEVGQYTIGICFDDLDKHKEAGVIWHNSTKSDIVLGKITNTHAISGDNFVLLEYKGGDFSNTTYCKGNFSTEIFIVCDRHETHQTPPRFLEMAGCTARFQLQCPLVCEPESPAIFPILLGWTVFIFSFYCLVGVIYRRFAVQARGCQQLPHLPFWSRIGGSCADGCNYACRCDSEQTTTWDADTDRDDVLLRP